MSDTNSEHWKQRSQSFGSVAEDYDRYRPGYPDQLFADVLAMAPGKRVLDVGSGTGHAAVGLAERGADVTGVEHDAAMAAIARDRGIPMIVSRFEDYVGAEGSFDLITCAQAWHWIDHQRGQDVAGRLLVPNGVLAIWWNRPAHFDGPVWDSIRAVYQQNAPALDRAKHLDERNCGGPMPASAAAFGDWEKKVFEWEQVYSAESYPAFLATHSDHILLAPDDRERLLTRVRDAIIAHGGSLTYSWRTLLYTARRI